MAHEIETMAYAGEVPWHGLGKKVLPDLTPEQMLEAADLDWTVEKQRLFVEWQGEQISTGKSALVRDRDGDVLDVVSNEWEPVQNAQAFGFFHDFIMEGDMEMHTAGSLKEGQMVWALAKVKDSFEVFGHDKIESYLLFSNPHQYGKCVDIRFTPIRVVCNNTLTFSLKSKSDLMIKLNHRHKFDVNLVKETLGIAHSQMDKYKEAAKFLGNKKAKPEDVKRYLGELFPVIGENLRNRELSKPAEKILELIPEQPGSEFAKGSWWQAFNGVTYATDHVLGFSNESRLRSAWYGTNRNKKVNAFKKAIEYAEAA